MDESLSALLEREHHEIDAGVEAFVAGIPLGEVRADQLNRAADALRRHVYLEEEFLFPPLRVAGMLPPILVMLREHGQLWRTLDEVQAMDLAAEGVAAGQRCEQLLAQLAAHNTKEEPIIYPQGDAVLDETATTQLREFIRAGQLPDGWVCAQAHAGARTT